MMANKSLGVVIDMCIPGLPQARHRQASYLTTVAAVPTTH